MPSSSASPPDSPSWFPSSGPWTGGVFGVVVTLAAAPEKALWVAVLYVAVQVAENTVLVNRIQGRALGIHPVWMTVIVVVAANYVGIWGVILGPSTVALVRTWPHGLPVNGIARSMRRRQRRAIATGNGRNDAPTHRA